jgi:hypothetical protein
MDPKEGRQLIKDFATTNGYLPNTGSDDELAEFLHEHRDVLQWIVSNAIIGNLGSILNWLERYRLIELDGMYISIKM